MDGSVVLLIQIPVTVFTVVVVVWRVHEKLRDRIDKAKDEAQAAKNAAESADDKLTNFTEICKTYRDGIEKRVSRLEKIQNSK